MDIGGIGRAAAGVIRPFGFATAGDIRFGRGVAVTAVPEIAARAARVLLVTGADSARAAWLAEALSARGGSVTHFAVPREPDMALIEQGVALARGSGAQAIVAIGGGAAIDAGKAIAALVPAVRPLLDHLEVVGQGLPLEADPLPFVAIPTTAGTGAEVTRNAVIAVPDARRKVSLRDPRMLPWLALVDPGLADHCPRAVTLASGLDALTQVIEPYVSSRANPLSDALCRAAIPAGLAALQRLMQGEDAGARDAMAFTSLCGGLALANAGLGVVHGLAGPLGGLSGAAHGALCGALLPAGLACNAQRGVAGARFDEIRRWIAAALGGPEAAAFDTLAAWSRAEGLPGLDALGVTPEAREAAALAAAGSSSMKANPVPLSPDDLRTLLRAAR